MIFNIYILVSILFIFTLFLFTIFLWFNLNKNKNIRFFTWLASTALLWMSLDLTTSFNFLSDLQALYLWRLGFISAFLFSLVFLAFVVVFFKKKINKIIFILISLFWFLTSIIVLFTDVLIKNVTKLQFPGQSNYVVGKFFIFILLFIFIPLFLSFLYLVKKYFQNYQKSRHYKKSQLKYILIGLIFPLIIAPSTNMFFPLLGINFPKLANLSVFIAMIFFFFAIYKDEFLGLTVRRFKIKTNIILPIILTAFLILSFSSIYSYFFNIKNLKKSIYSQLEVSSLNKVSQIKTILLAYESRVKLMTSKTWLKKYLEKYLDTREEEYQKKIEEIIYDVQRENPNFLHILIINSQGKVIVSSDSKYLNKDFSDRKFFQKGKITYAISDYHQPESDGARLYLSGPLIQNEKFLGVIALASDGKGLERVLTEYTGLRESGEMYLVNHNAYMISPSKFKSNTFLREKVNTYEVNLCLGKEKENKSNSIFQKNTYLNYLGREVFGTHIYIPEMQWCLISEIDKSAISNQIFDLIKFSIIRILVVLSAFFLVAYLLARAISKPILALKEGVEVIENGNLNYKVATDAQDEIGDLARAFDKMTESIKKSRLEIDKKVKEQTIDIQERQKYIEDQQMAVLNILEDVEEEKNKTLSLAQDLEKFKLAVDNASDHIVITDPDGIILYANSAVEKITGYAKKEIMGQKAGSKDNWGGLMEVKIYKEMWKIIKKEKSIFTGDLKNRRKNGEEYDAIANIIPIFDQQKNLIFFLGMERDITREKAIDKAKTEFVSLASHQLRTPLSSINWYTEMLLDGDAGKLNAEQRDYLEEIYHGNQRMVKLVNSLLNVSRLELGTFMVNPKLVDIRKIADMLIKELKPKIKSRSIEFTKNYDIHLPKIKLDVELITMVIQNLLSNAIKYTPAKGKVSLNISRVKDKFIIQVKDSGYGIPKYQQDKIFSKLFRADNIKEKDTEGTGLGLYVIKSIIDNSNGKIYFKSRINKGTTFYVEMPLSGMQKKEGSRKLN